MIKNHKQKSVLVFIPAQNFNEHEYLIITNVITSSGYKAFIVSDSNFLCIGANGLKVKNDVQLYNANENNFGGLILIGGNGTRNYWSNSALQSLVKKFAAKGKPIGAICCAPIVLAKAGVIKEKATCFIDDKKELEREGIEFINSSVVQQKNILTAQEPSSSSDFIKAFIAELSKQ